MTYGYVRVSSQTQNTARQMEEMRKYGLTHNYIYVDSIFGKIIGFFWKIFLISFSITA